jgi:hypothetical protein
MPVVAGAVRNAPKGLRPWISFLKKHGGKGYTREKLVRMFHRERGTSRRKPRRTRSARRARRKTRRGGAYESESEESE